MAQNRIGRTAVFRAAPAIVGYAAVGGKMEGEGPLAHRFDETHTDPHVGEKTWEKAESRMVRDALARAAAKASAAPHDLDLIFSGDLLNQCIATSFGLRESGAPICGLYGACSTFAEGLMLAAAAIDGGYADRAAAIASSHFCTAERQYRTPLGYGSQRPPAAQWTVSGAGAAVLATDGDRAPIVTHATAGRIVDLGVTDQANMGAAMAPAAADTLAALFADTKTAPADYDLVLTGDLGAVGLDLLCDLLSRDGITFPGNLNDCGLMIYDRERQDVHAGGSGCGCSATVFCADILDRIRAGELRKVVLAGTGALLSPTSTLQGESIPGICHAVVVETAHGR